MSPEMLNLWRYGARGYTKAVDMYSFATMAFEVLFGVDITKLYVWGFAHFFQRARVLHLDDPTLYDSTVFEIVSQSVYMSQAPMLAEWALLLAQCLRFDPKERPSAEDILNNDFVVCLSLVWNVHLYSEEQLREHTARVIRMPCMLYACCGMRVCLSNSFSAARYMGSEECIERARPFFEKVLHEQYPLLMGRENFCGKRKK